MIVCNLAVLVTWSMRALGHRDDSEFEMDKMESGSSPYAPKGEALA